CAGASSNYVRIDIDAHRRGSIVSVVTHFGDTCEGGVDVVVGDRDAHRVVVLSSRKDAGGIQGASSYGSAIPDRVSVNKNVGLFEACDPSVHSDAAGNRAAEAYWGICPNADACYAEFANAVVDDPGVDVAGCRSGVSHIQEDALLLHVGQGVVVNIDSVGNVGLIVKQYKDRAGWAN